MHRRFTVMWILYWTTYFIQPIRSIYDGVIEAFLLQFLFFSFVLLGMYTLKMCTTSIKTSTLPFTHSKFEQSYSEKIIIVGLLLSTIGLGSLLYDKIAIQGIDYTDGLAIAREQWRREGEDRQGQKSSYFSAVGYLLGSCYFLSLAVLLSKDTVMSDGRRLSYIIFTCLLLLMNSLITGGRSSILLIFAFVTFAAANSKSNTNQRLFKSRTIPRVLFILCILFFLYTLYVFVSRSEASELEVAAYSINFMDYLGIKLYSDFQGYIIQNSQLGQIAAVVNLALSYLTHSMSTTAAMINEPPEKAILLFIHVSDLIHKLGLIEKIPSDWFLAGRFPSLPGALFFQFNIFWLTFIALVLGVISAFAEILYLKRGRGKFLLLICCLIETILLMSPFLFAADFLSYPFIFIGGIITLLSAFFLSKKPPRVGSISAARI